MIFFDFFLFAIAGLILGSFATALAHREAHDIAWWSFNESGARSACVSCKKTLGVRDLVPVISWLISKGRCRHCAAPLSPAYPLMEVGCALSALLVYLFHGFSVEAAFILMALPFLGALLLVDIRHMILPNRLVIIIGLIGLARLLVEGYVLHTLEPALILTNYIAAFFMYALFIWGLARVIGLVLKKQALGMGDVKFFAVAGLWLGLEALPFFCVIAGVAGVALGLLWQKLRNQNVFPFGPALIFSFYILLLVDGSLLTGNALN